MTLQKFVPRPSRDASLHPLYARAHSNVCMCPYGIHLAGCRGLNGACKQNHNYPQFNGNNMATMSRRRAHKGSVIKAGFAAQWKNWENGKSEPDPTRMENEFFFCRFAFLVFRFFLGCVFECECRFQFIIIVRVDSLICYYDVCECFLV